MSRDTFVETSVARHMLSRMQVTHARRRIAVFSGPPGIGKTTAVDVFQARLPGEVVVAKVAKKGAKEVLVLQHVFDAVQQANGVARWVPSSIWELRKYLSRAICQWADLDFAAASTTDKPEFDPPCRTVVFDEAQNLSREAIEVLRYWNDADRCYSPFPLGLIFVGNAEFSLAESGAGASTISTAVADRAYHIQTLEYEDLTDDDLRLFIKAQGIADAGAVALILRQLRTQRAVRSLRRLSDLVEDLRDEAGRHSVTVETVRAVLQPV